jgi:hypothetical protein
MESDKIVIYKPPSPYETLEFILPLYKGSGSSFVFVSIPRTKTSYSIKTLKEITGGDNTYERCISW